jgi:hypothetical protein
MMTAAQRQAKRRASGIPISVVLREAESIAAWQALLRQHGTPMAALKALLSATATSGGTSAPGEQPPPPASHHDAEARQAPEG